MKLPPKAGSASLSSDGTHFTRKRHHTPATVPRTRLPPGTPMAERLAMESLKQKLSFEEKPEVSLVCGTYCKSPALSSNTFCHDLLNCNYFLIATITW